MGEFGGAAFHGPLLDLSEGGFQMRVDQTNEDLESESLGEGQELAIVRVTGLDGGELETSGRLVYLARGKAGLRVGIRFRNLRPEARSRLEAYLRPRVVEPPTTLPPLAYKPGGEEGVAETEGALAEARSETLLRLKKRGRTLVFAMPPGPDRERAQSFLQEQGFGRVLGVETLAELMEILEVLPIHAVIIDQGVTEMGGLELASFIHYAKAEGPCRILLVEDQAHPSRESLVRRAGVDRVLLRPYLGMGLVTALEEELELRPRQVPQEVLETSAPSAGKSRVIRRFRGVALVMPPGPDREALGAFLAREGFTRVVPAGTIAELVRTLDSSALALLFIDWPDPDVQELEIAHFLESVRFEGKVQLLLASSKPSPRMVGDAKALGVAHVLVKPYALDGALADLLTGYLGDGGE